jgi:hypothetical protein
VTHTKEDGVWRALRSFYSECDEERNSEYGMGEGGSAAHGFTGKSVTEPKMAGVRTRMQKQTTTTK